MRQHNKTGPTLASQARLAVTRGFATIALAMLLTACWAGPAFYGVSDYTTPIRSGLYEADGEKGLVAIAPGGVTVVGTSRLALVPLTAKPDHYVAFDMGEPLSTEAPEIPYWLIRIVPGGFRIAMPSCESNRNVAILAGAKLLEDRLVPTCVFADRQSLEQALAAISDHELDWIELRLVGP